MLLLVLACRLDVAVSYWMKSVWLPGWRKCVLTGVDDDVPRKDGDLWDPCENNVLCDQFNIGGEGGQVWSVADPGDRYPRSWSFKLTGTNSALYLYLTRTLNLYSMASIQNRRRACIDLLRTDCVCSSSSPTSSFSVHHLPKTVDANSYGVIRSRSSAVLGRPNDSKRSGNGSSPKKLYHLRLCLL